LFEDGNDIGLEIQYLEQASPGGIAQAFIIGAEFIGQSSVCLILGDNISTETISSTRSSAPPNYARAHAVRLSRQRSGTVWHHRVRRQRQGNQPRGKACGASFELGGHGAVLL